MGGSGPCNAFEDKLASELEEVTWVPWHLRPVLKWSSQFEIKILEQVKYDYILLGFRRNS